MPVEEYRTAVAKATGNANSLPSFEQGGQRFKGRPSQSVTSAIPASELHVVPMAQVPSAEARPALIYRPGGIAREHRAASHAVHPDRFAGAKPITGAGALRSSRPRGGRFGDTGQYDGRPGTGRSDVRHDFGSAGPRSLATVDRRTLRPTGVDVGPCGKSSRQLTGVRTEIEWPFLQGGSYPPGWKGWQRRIRHTPRNDPEIAPYLRTARIKYSLQEG